MKSLKNSCPMYSSASEKILLLNHLTTDCQLVVPCIHNNHHQKLFDVGIVQYFIVTYYYY